LRQLAGDGKAIVIVTHKLDEVRAVADDVTVLRAGKTVATLTGEEIDVGAIARAMVGADLPRPGRIEAPAATAPDALALGRVPGAPGLAAIDLRVRAREIIGIAGVDGNGQRELAHAIAGLVDHAGSVRIGGRDVSRAGPAGRLAAGLAHI